MISAAPANAPVHFKVKVEEDLQFLFCLFSFFFGGRSRSKRDRERGAIRLSLPLLLPNMNK